MAEIRRQPFQTVKVDIEEMDRKIREHRIRMLKRAGIVLGILILLWFLLYIYHQVRTYDSHEAKVTEDRQDSAANTYLEFQGNILKYSNDGAFYTDTSNELIWNQSYEMSDPVVVMSAKYAAIGDEKGTLVYIFDKDGLCGKIETTKPIVRVKIAEQGTVALLLEENGVSYLKLCDKAGKTLAEGELHVENSGYPMDIALSKDGKRFAVSMFDHVVGTKKYSDIIIPQIEFLGNDKLIAVSDQKLMLLEVSGKPQEKKSIKYGSRLRTIFYNGKYIGLILDNESSSKEEKNDVYCMQIYDNRGALVKEKTFSRTYRKAEFLNNNEVCLLNDNECTIFTLRGVEKYHEAWDKSIYKVLPGRTASRYTFILDGETVQAKLK